MEIRVEIDLDIDQQTFFYGNDLLFRGSWTDGMSGGGSLNIAAVDLFANSTTEVYYDDISLGQLVDAPWLSTNPTSGTTPPTSSSPVNVLLDATGLTPGTYMANLYVESNDPVNPVIAVPVTMIVKASADLAITKADSADPVKVGDQFTYTLSVSNNGPDDATGVVVVDTLPAGVTFVSASAGCVEAGGVVTCTIGDLANAGTVERSIVVIAPSVTGTITNTATVSGDVIDANLSNNTDSEDTVVGPDLYITYLPIILK